MFRTIIFAATTSLIAGAAVAGSGLNASLQHAIDSDDRVLAAGIQSKIDTGKVSFTTRSNGVSGYEAALKHAIDSDNRALVRSLKAKLGR